METIEQRVRPMWRGLCVAFAGPVAVGAAVGLPGGIGEGLKAAVLLPSVLLGVACMMMPALYITAAVTRVAPPMLDVVRRTGSALAGMGLVFLGFAAPLAFLVAATTEPAIGRILGNIFIGFAVVTSLRSLYLKLFNPGHFKALALFTGWAGVTMGIGGSLLASV